MTLGQYAKRNPDALVKVTFEDGCTFTLAACDAVCPNASMRYFPDLKDGETYGEAVARLGWKRPMAQRLIEAGYCHAAQ